VDQLLVDRGTQALGVKNRIGLVPLHFAAGCAPVQVVQLLVNGLPEALQMKATDGWLPLHYAAMYDAPLEIIYHLLKACPLVLG
jgi:ankyrin repeat protein